MLCGRAKRRETDKTSEVSKKKEKYARNTDPPAQHLRPSSHGLTGFTVRLRKGVSGRLELKLTSVGRVDHTQMPPCLRWVSGSHSPPQEVSCSPSPPKKNKPGMFKS
ncbi:unnamed protein product [Rangifer tarandus platyrhynchus]|uniref:Uncharacterized protein n=1 Tax=Rangifer tarandus platyrhynchus TaxID=3082113 RepID=A0ABN8ZZ24_RANTA|nr:unnamed protein product [Rangifer tarandus platyrhynchus]